MTPKEESAGPREGLCYWQAKRDEAASRLADLQRRNSASDVAGALSERDTEREWATLDEMRGYAAKVREYAARSLPDRPDGLLFERLTSRLPALDDVEKPARDIWPRDDLLTVTARLVALAPFIVTAVVGGKWLLNLPLVGSVIDGALGLVVWVIAGLISLAAVIHAGILVSLTGSVDLDDIGDVWFDEALAEEYWLRFQSEDWTPRQRRLASVATAILMLKKPAVLVIAPLAGVLMGPILSAIYRRELRASHDNRRALVAAATFSFDFVTTCRVVFVPVAFASFIVVLAALPWPA